MLLKRFVAQKPTTMILLIYFLLKFSKTPKKSVSCKIFMQQSPLNHKSYFIQILKPDLNLSAQRLIEIVFTMSKKHKTYTAEFKAEAIKAIEENKGNVSETARQLGISMKTYKIDTRKQRLGH